MNVFSKARPIKALAAAAASADGGWSPQREGRLFHSVCPRPSTPAETTAIPPAPDKHHGGRPTNLQPPPTPATPVHHVDNIHEVTKKPFVAKGPQQFAMNASNSTSLCYCSSSTCIPGGRS